MFLAIKHRTITLQSPGHGLFGCEEEPGEEMRLTLGKQSSQQPQRMETSHPAALYYSWLPCSPLTPALAWQRDSSIWEEITFLWWHIKMMTPLARLIYHQRKSIFYKSHYFHPTLCPHSTHGQKLTILQKVIGRQIWRTRFSRIFLNRVEVSKETIHFTPCWK